MLGEIDLSANQMQRLISLVCGTLLQRPFAELSSKFFPNLVAPPAIAVLLLAIAIGAFFGVISGVVVSKFKAPSFVATFGTKFMLYGITFWYIGRGAEDGYPIGGYTDEFKAFVKGRATILGISIPYFVFYAIIAAAIMWFIWNKTALGKSMYAVGANPEAARVSGISVIKTTVLVFMISGMCFGFSGFIEAASAAGGAYNQYDITEILAILACMIGGISITGGVGKIRSIVIGAFLFAIFINALHWLRAPSHLQNLLTGALFVAAVVVNKKRYSISIR